MIKISYSSIPGIFHSTILLDTERKVHKDIVITDQARMCFWVTHICLDVFIYFPLVIEDLVRYCANKVYFKCRLMFHIEFHWFSFLLPLRLYSFELN